MRSNSASWSFFVAVAAGVGVSLSAARTARAQAWLPPKGEASVTVGLASRFANQHLDDQGRNLELPWGAPGGWGSMYWNDAAMDLGYGITDRLAVSARLPFVLSRYEGQFPHPPVAGHRDQDNGDWHGGFGDFRAEVRFKATKGSLVVTPLVALSIPTGYEYYAHATPGLGLTEGQVGVSLGRLLDPVLSNGYVQARYTFTVPEKVLGMSHNRSNVFLDLGYFVTSALTVSAIGEWQQSYGGWRQADIPLPPSPDFLYHDQLLRSNHLRLGGEVAYALSGSLELALAGYGTVYGHADMNVAGFTLNMTYGFSPSQVIKKTKGTPKTPAVRPGSPS